MDLGLVWTSWNLAWLAGASAIVVLLLLLIASFLSRPRMFCQYLRHMTGIQLDCRQVQGIYRKKGRAGVRDHLMDLLIQEDLADPRRVVTPDSAPDTSVFEGP